MAEQEAGVALVVVAHPDDAELGCGGTVAQWAKEGWTVYFAISTDASGGGADDAVDVGPEARRAISERRKAEQRAAAAVLGVREVFFLDRPDGRLEPTLDFRRDIVRLIRQCRPQRLVCQSPDRTWSPHYIIGRQHPDHLATGQATIAAFYPAAQNAWDFPELLDEGLLPHKVRELYVIAAPVLNHPVDISGTVELKIAALREHQSQLGARFDEVEARVREFSARLGAEHGFANAEVFHRTEH
jgi:LmbE family N-acetylglucosaminyl deacetylase